MSQTLSRETIAQIINLLVPYITVDYQNVMGALLASDIDITALRADVKNQAYVGNAALIALLEHGLAKQLKFIHPNWTQQTITSIEKTISQSGNITWKCTLLNREKFLYVRQTNKALFLVHYPDIEQLALNFPVKANITVYTEPDGDFLTLREVIEGGTMAYAKVVASSDDIRKASARAKLGNLKPASYVDFESTCLGANAEIVQYGLVIEDDGTAEKFLSLVKPEEPEWLSVVQKNDKSAQDIHGISAEMLISEKPFEEHYQLLKTHLHDKTVVTYGDFDLRTLSQVCARHELEAITPSRHINLMEIYAEYHGEAGFRADEYKWQSLEAAYQQMTGNALAGAHNALNDAQAMREIIALMTLEA
jgi:inhibitor of KinA sporulation pathway (predicted exonuclease)